MNAAEAAVLLAMAATIDNRKPDEDAAKAWAAMLDDIRFEDAREVVIAHYRTSTDWLMPAKVRTDVRRIRAKRIADHPPLVPPPGLDTAETIAWLAETTRRVGNGEQIDGYAGIELVSTPGLPRLLATTTEALTEENAP